jgi:citrate synthase
MASTLDRVGRQNAKGSTERSARRRIPMTEVHHGLEGVIAFESEIAEPDKEGSALRYRGVDIEEIAGRIPFENVWGLLVDGSYTPGLPPAEPYNIAIHTGDVRADV